MNKQVTVTDTGLFIRLGGTVHRSRKHRHVWYVDSHATRCGVCGKPHPRDGK